MMAERPGPVRYRGCPGSATGLVVLLGLQLWHVASGDRVEVWALVLVAALFLLVLPVSTALWLGRIGECRLFAFLIAAGVGGAQLMVMIVGAPGGLPTGWDTGRVVVAVLAVALVGLVSIRTRKPVKPHLNGYKYAGSDDTAPAGRRGR